MTTAKELENYPVRAGALTAALESAKIDIERAINILDIEDAYVLTILRSRVGQINDLLARINEADKAIDARIDERQERSRKPFAVRAAATIRILPGPRDHLTEEDRAHIRAYNAANPDALVTETEYLWARQGTPESAS